MKINFRGAYGNIQWKLCQHRFLLKRHQKQQDERCEYFNSETVGNFMPYKAGISLLVAPRIARTRPNKFYLKQYRGLALNHENWLLVGIKAIILVRGTMKKSLQRCPRIAYMRYGYALLEPEKQADSNDCEKIFRLRGMS